MFWWFFFLSLWVICGVVTYGATFAYFYREFPYLQNRKDRLPEVFEVSAFFGLFGLVGLFAAYVGSEGFKHGFKFIPRRDIKK